MGDVDGDADVGEVEAVAERDEGQSDDVVAHELLEVLTRLLHAQEEDDGLLGPVGSLEEVVELDSASCDDVGNALYMPRVLKYQTGVRLMTYMPSGTEDAKVDGRVHLLHETGLLALAEASSASRWAQYLLHDELASEREDNGVEGDKGNVPFTLAILVRFAGGRSWGAGRRGR